MAACTRRTLAVVVVAWLLLALGASFALGGHSGLSVAADDPGPSRLHPFEHEQPVSRWRDHGQVAGDYLIQDKLPLASLRRPAAVVRGPKSAATATTVTHAPRAAAVASNGPPVSRLPLRGFGGLPGLSDLRSGARGVVPRPPADTAKSPPPPPATASPAAPTSRPALLPTVAPADALPSPVVGELWCGAVTSSHPSSSVNHAAELALDGGVPLYEGEPEAEAAAAVERREAELLGKIAASRGAPNGGRQGKPSRARAGGALPQYEEYDYARPGGPAAAPDVLRREALGLRRLFRETLWAPPNVTAPSHLRRLPVLAPLPSSSASSVLGPSSTSVASSVTATRKELAVPSIVYLVLTGNTSHATRVRGLHDTLGRVRDVRWYSDAPDAVIRPTVLASAFEDDVCRKQLAADTQLKGCRYQRNFYRAVHLWEAVAGQFDWRRNAEDDDDDDDAAGAPHREDDTSIGSKTSRPRRVPGAPAWFVRLSDDTLVIPPHLETVLATLDPAQPFVVGRNESRSSYWFFSGGHPVAFSRAAVRRWLGADGNTSAAPAIGGGRSTPPASPTATGVGASPGRQHYYRGDASRCEGVVVDRAPSKLRKFWWWADDVLVSFCLQQPRSVRSSDGGVSGGYLLRSLPGAISATTFRAAPLPVAVGACVSVSARNTSLVSPPGPGGHVTASPVPTPGGARVLPVSYHAYPFTTPAQMFGVWNWLFVRP